MNGDIREKLSILFPNLDEEVMDVIIAKVRCFILDYCNVEEVPEALEAAALAMCEENISKLGSQGVSSESAGGSSVSYMDDYSPSVYRQLKKFRRIKVI